MLPSKYAVHLLACSEYETVKSLPTYYGEIDRKYRNRYLMSKIMSAITEPVRDKERRLFENQIQDHKLQQDPIFVIGHWRSGTTHLTNLLTRDKQFGFVSYQQCFFPNMCISNQKPLKPLMRLLLPGKRPMDNMKVDLELPQEEEFALGARGKHSFYHGFFFPQQLDHLFNKYVTFAEMDDHSLEEWKSSYMQVIRTASYLNDGKQLILKTPMNTSRIPEIISLFPNAKFIFISRNPDDVYFSTVNLFRRMIKHYQFHGHQEDELQSLVRGFYSKMMGRYFETRPCLNEDQLVEVNYEQLTNKPIETIETIYSGLKLSNFQKSKLDFNEYLSSLKSYRKNSFNKPDDVLDSLRNEWDRYYQLLGY